MTVPTQDHPHHSRPSRWTGRGAGVALSVIAMVIMFAAPVQASIVDSGRFNDEFSDTYFACGFPVQVEGSAHGKYRIRAGTGELATAFFLHSNVTWQEVHTANGRSITLRGHSLYNEPKAVPVDGSIFEFRAIEAGQPFSVYDADGNLVLRDRGAIRTTYLFDTQGDDEPGGLIVELIDVQLRGPHPSWGTDWSAICALFA